MTDDTMFLVHGYMDDTDRRRWDELEQRLVDDGYDAEDIYRVSFSTERGYDMFLDGVPGTTTDHPERYAEELEEAIEEVYEGEGVSILAHSMGGLAARQYIEERGGEEYVDSLVTLGTPHQGSVLANVGLHTRGGRAMRPGSEFLDELNDDIADDVEYTAVWSRDDRMIQPSENARLPFEDRENVHDIEVEVRTGLFGFFTYLGSNHLKLMDPELYEEYGEFL